IMDRILNAKHEQLKKVFEAMGKVLVAYSGGVDSSLLLKMAIDALGRENVLAVTALSPLYPERELATAKKVAESMGVRHLLIEANELEFEGFSSHRPSRCVYCKVAR